MAFARLALVMTALLRVVPSAWAQQDTAATTAPVEEATGNTELARQRLLQGIALFDARDFPAALVEFEASLDLYASPNSHLYIARCHANLQHWVQAYLSYRSSIALAEDRAQSDPRYRDTAQAARQELSGVEKQVGLVKLVGEALPQGATVTFAGQLVPHAAFGLSIPALPGSTKVVIAIPGEPTVAQTVDVKAATTVTVVLRAGKGNVPVPVTVPLLASTPSMQPSRGPNLRPWAYSAWGLGALSLGTFVATRVLAKRKFDEIDARCNPRPCSEMESGAISDGRRLDRIADFSLMGALTFAALGTTLWWLQPNASN